MAASTSSSQSSSSGFDPARLRAKYRQERDKRLRPDGNAQYLDVSGDYAIFAADSYLESSSGGQPRDARLARVHVDRARYDAECTPSYYYNNEGKLDRDIRITRALP